MKLNKKIAYGIGVLVFTVSAITVVKVNAVGNNIPSVGTEQNYSLPEIVSNDIVYDDLSVNAEPFDYSNTGVKTETEIPENDYIAVEEEINILKDSSKLRGDSKPKTFHDLTSRNYTYSLPSVHTSYTNRYFNTNSNGEIRIQINNLYPYDKTFKIICYHVDGTEVTTWEGKPSDGYNALFYNLDPDSHYYFYFKAIGFANFLKGDGKIYH